MRASARRCGLNFVTKPTIFRVTKTGRRSHSRCSLSRVAFAGRPTQRGGLRLQQRSLWKAAPAAANADYAARAGNAALELLSITYSPGMFTPKAPDRNATGGFTPWVGRAFAQRPPTDDKVPQIFGKCWERPKRGALMGHFAAMSPNTAVRVPPMLLGKTYSFTSTGLPISQQ